MHVSQNILLLIEKYQSGTISSEEMQELNHWYHSFSDNKAEITLSTTLTEEDLSELIKNKTLASIAGEGGSRPFWVRHRRWLMPAAAAALAVILGTYFLTQSSASTKEIPETETAETPPPQDLAPGGDKALLTLEDGSVIVLDSASKGIISLQDNIKVVKLANGQVVYEINGRQLSPVEETAYNTISTPRGGQFQVTLSDGTKVWLNAASSIRFPVVFTGNERKVEITGEAYLEVAKNVNMPFRTKVGDSEIEVLGTHFNVNAYDNETAIRTTLLEGRVNVHAPDKTVKPLSPGQQSAIHRSGKVQVLNNADTEEAVAWINGRFQYNSTDIGTILRQIERWYDVDVEYRGKVNMRFTGQLNRSVFASKIFEKLALTDEVSFKIDGRKIIVSPKN